MGNGRAIALRLASEGADVAVTDIDLVKAEQTVAALPGRGLALQSDAADPAACTAVVLRAERELGPLDVVVCNVAINPQQPGRVQGVAEWDRTVAINLRSHWLTAQAALEPMMSRGRGNFVFVTSLAGLVSPGSSLSYEVTKAGLIAVARHFGVRYARRGIRANALALGIIDSTMVRRYWGDDEVARAWRGSQCPMGRQGTTYETAAAVAFLASDDAGFITGTCLVMDGGQLASGMPTDAIPVAVTQRREEAQRA
ncbi:SDR family NAD(P)-dependent oxidoreductase [Nocardioides terrisoli]|uniref:SDR family NAD(P)-dependent oxidoreductase n=1 Tax=Nocardioides terrisoli TaxID=3388267 RepID=UPI00287BA5B7|nr:SDR family NAD(P)-dependent oxidoreductase [Nocardioides marmorisolisilvae]